MRIAQRLEAILASGQRGVHVSVDRALGSTPRDAGAAMLVLESGDFYGTIGGGALEWEALRIARGLLTSRTSGAQIHDMALGPELAQCCGGRMALRFECFGPGDRARAAEMANAVAEQDAFTPLALFGAGHVGRALVLALAPLPFAIRWIDARADMFPAAVPANAVKVAAGDPEAEIEALSDGSFVLVMTHSHALDLAIVSRALALDRFPFVGLIGSKTKRVRFERRMVEAGLSQSAQARLVCPVGIDGIESKEPAMIAASMAARLLIAREICQGISP